MPTLHCYTSTGVANGGTCAIVAAHHVGNWCYISPLIRWSTRAMIVYYPLFHTCVMGLLAWYFELGICRYFELGICTTGMFSCSCSEVVRCVTFSFLYSRSMEAWVNFPNLAWIFSYVRGNGFLRYFQLKQLPNFLLAAPILSLAVYSTIQYAKLRPEIVFSLGFRSSKAENNFTSVLDSPGRDHALKGDQVLEKSLSSKSMQGILWTHFSLYHCLKQITLFILFIFIF